MSSALRTLVRRMFEGLATVVRVLFGMMLVFSGTIWLGRPDAGAYLLDALNTIFESGTTVGFYRPFLTDVVVPNVDLFALLVSWGELLSGVSLLFGVASRVGAGVISFQFLNYGLMGGYGSLLSHAIMAALAIGPVALKTNRRFGVDRWLHARWPRARIW